MEQISGWKYRLKNWISIKRIKSSFIFWLYFLRSRGKCAAPDVGQARKRRTVMRGLKQFFRMIVAAVVCFTVSVFSGSKKEKIMELLDQGKNK